MFLVKGARSLLTRFCSSPTRNPPSFPVFCSFPICHKGEAEAEGLALFFFFFFLLPSCKKTKITNQHCPANSIQKNVAPGCPTSSSKRAGAQQSRRRISVSLEQQSRQPSAGQKSVALLRALPQGQVGSSSDPGCASPPRLSQLAPIHQSGRETAASLSHSTQPPLHATHGHPTLWDLPPGVSCWKGEGETHKVQLKSRQPNEITKKNTHKCSNMASAALIFSFSITTRSCSASSEHSCAVAFWPAL